MPKKKKKTVCGPSVFASLGSICLSPPCKLVRSVVGGPVTHVELVPWNRVGTGMEVWDGLDLLVRVKWTYILYNGGSVSYLPGAFVCSDIVGFGTWWSYYDS